MSELQDNLHKSMSERFDELEDETEVETDETDGAPSEDGEDQPESEGQLEASGDGEESAEGNEEESETVEEEEDLSEKIVFHAPDTWTAEAKNEWANMSKRAQEEVLKRETDFQEEFTKNADRIQFAARMERVAQPYMAAMNANGVTPEQNFQNLLNTQYQLMNGTPQEVTQMALQLIETYGGDKSFLNQPQDTTHDPRYDKLIGTVNTLNQRLQQQEQQRVQNEEAQLNNIIIQFQNELDEQGNKKHPYFSNVANELPAVIELERQKNPMLSERELLEKAYNEAIWLNPSTRALMQGETLSTNSRNATKAAKERVEKAKTAQKQNLAKKPQLNGDKAEPKRNLRGTLEHTFDKLNA